MPSNDDKEKLLERIKTLSGLLKAGRYDEIDFTALEKEAPDIAGNFSEVVKNLESAGEKISLDSHDLPSVDKYLTHITKTTENAVTEVLNTAESIMDDTAKAGEILGHIDEQIPDNNEKLKNEIHYVKDLLDNVQDKSFSVITSLEFEDINRQLSEKIVARLDELYGNLLEIMIILKFKESINKEDSDFLKSLKRIFDIDDAARHSQEVADELFEEF